MISSLHCMYIGHPGVVLFSLLFSLCANDCFSKDLSVRIVMFDDGHRPYQGHRCGVEQLALWCSQISLELNTLKTVAVTVELRSPSPLCLLATIFQDLKWSLSIDTIIKKAEQSLRQLRKFNLPQEVMIYSTLQ